MTPTKLTVSTTIGLDSLRISAHEVYVDISIQTEESVAHALDIMRQATLSSLLDNKVIDQRAFDNLSRHKLG